MFFLKNQNLQMRKMIVSKECDEIYQTEQIFFFASGLYILIKSLFNNKKVIFGTLLNM